MNNDSLSKMNPNNSDANVLAKSLNKITLSKNNSHKIDFSLEMINGKINSKIDSSSKGINELTVSNIGDRYISYLKNKKINDKSFLVISDKNFDAKVFSQIFASSLKSNDVQVFFASNNKSVNLATAFLNIDESFGGIIKFSLNEVENNVLSISFFNNDGTFISAQDSLLFNIDDSNTLELNLKAYDEQIDTLPELNANKYMLMLPFEKNLSNLTVSINNSYKMNDEVINNFFSRNKIKYIESKSKAPNKDKNIKKAIFNSMKNRGDVAVSLISNNDEFELAIRHKNHYKFFDLNDLSAMYLYYQIKHNNKDEKYFKNKYIVTNISSSYLSSIIAKKHKIETKEYDNFHSNISNNKDLSLDMLFATNGKNYFISKGQSNYISDPFYNLQLFLEMISFYIKQNKNLYDVMIEINAEYGIYRHSVNEQKMDDVTYRKFINLTSKELKIANQNIVRLENFKTENKNIKITKITLEDKTKISFIYSDTTNSLKIYLSLFFKPKKTSNLPIKKTLSLDKNGNYINLIIQEKKIIEAIKAFNDDYSKKTFSWRDLVKYFVFIAIFISIFIILFSTLYSSDEGPMKIFNELNNLIIKTPLLMYLLPFLVILVMFPIICNSILIGRMLRVQGQKVKVRHLVIASSIGVVISSITPMSIGGDIAAYWYLKRKSFKRETLIATFLATSFLYQVVGAITSLIFIPMGLFVYGEVLLSGSAESITILTLVLIGFFSNIIAAIFIGVFSFNKKAQSLFIKFLVWLIEWNPFITSRDPSAKAASFQYAFIKIRTSSLTIFKNTGVTLEFIFWRILPIFLNLGAILAILSGFMKPSNELWGGQYINFMIGNSIVSSANMLSITPGGSGTSQWLQTAIYEPLFKEGHAVEYSKMFSLLSTLLFFIVPTILSALLLFTVWMGEKRIDKYEKIKRVILYENKNYKNKNIRKHTVFFKISSIIWVTGIMSAMLIYYLNYLVFM